MGCVTMTGPHEHRQRASATTGSFVTSWRGELSENAARVRSPRVRQHFWPLGLGATQPKPPARVRPTIPLRLIFTLPRFLALAAALLLAAPLRAHDPAESWTEVVVHANEMELLVTTAQVNALKLIDPTNKIPVLTQENFSQHRARLIEAGASLFTVTSIKAPMRPRKVEVQLTEENDVVFTITYPRPAPGLLIFNAAFLKKLGEGFGGIIDASDTAGHHLGWDQISWENTSLVVMLPAPDAPPAKKD